MYYWQKLMYIYFNWCLNFTTLGGIVFAFQFLQINHRNLKGTNANSQGKFDFDFKPTDRKSMSSGAELSVATLKFFFLAYTDYTDMERLS